MSDPYFFQIWLIACNRSFAWTLKLKHSIRAFYEPTCEELRIYPLISMVVMIRPHIVQWPVSFIIKEDFEGS